MLRSIIRSNGGELSAAYGIHMFQNLFFKPRSTCLYTLKSILKVSIIIRIIETGEKFTVQDIDGIIRKDEYDGKVKYFNNDDGVKIKMQNGEIGWIGGFHMVWD